MTIKDDLTKIEGIDSQIEAALNGVAINTYIGVAATSVTALQDIITNAGASAPSKTVATWPAQAKRAASGDWDGMMAATKAQA